MLSYREFQLLCGTRLQCHLPIRYFVDATPRRQQVRVWPSSESISSFEEFCRHPDEPNAIPIDPAILGNEDLMETSALYQDTCLSDCMGSICQETTYPYPESPFSDGFISQNTLPHMAGSPCPCGDNQQLHFVDEGRGTNVICPDSQGEHCRVESSGQSTTSRKRPSGKTTILFN
jgi:hypothetical protein